MPSASDNEQSILSPQEVTRLLSTLQAEVVGLKAEGDSLRETIVNLTHENTLLKRRLYGNKTERLRTSELQLSLGDLLATEEQLQKDLDDAVRAAEADARADAEDAPPDARSKRKSRGRRDLSTSTLPRVQVDFTDEHLEKGAKRIGFDESFQLMYRPGGFAVLVKRVAKYEVPSKQGPTVLGLLGPKSLFPRGLLHTSAVAHLIVQKFALGVPFNRLEQHLESQACQIDRATMCRYTEDAGNTLGATIVQAMWDDALANAGVISTDATGAMIQPLKGESNLKQACKKGHFFTAVVDRDYVLFAYTEKHNQDFVKKLFGRFTGFLQSDASNVYDILDRGPPDETDKGIALVGCFAHCRRYFFDAAVCRYSVGVQGLMRIGAIYAADEPLKKLPPAKRKTLRDQHVRPLLEDFFEWVRASSSSVEGSNLATKALGYATNQELELRRVLDDPRLPLDNTRSERALRKVVVGRKSWMFYGSDTHAEAAAALFSIVASCRLHRLDPERYLDEIFRLLPYWPQERYLELAPHKWSATRAKLDTAELERPLGAFTIPTH